MTETSISDKSRNMHGLGSIAKRGQGVPVEPCAQYPLTRRLGPLHFRTRVPLDSDAYISTKRRKNGRLKINIPFNFAIARMDGTRCPTAVRCGDGNVPTEKAEFACTRTHKLASTCGW
jgi:hypothetical protein